MTDSQAKAKKMYFDYACRTFFMHHDGVLEEYESYEISEAQENEWRQEYIAYWVSRLDSDDLAGVNRLRDADASEAIPAMMQLVVNKGDGYSKLCIANAIWYLAHRIAVSQSLQEQAIITALEIWQLLTQGPIEISDAHKAAILPYLADASSPEEYVSNCAKRKLAEA